MTTDRSVSADLRPETPFAMKTSVLNVGAEQGDVVKSLQKKFRHSVTDTGNPKTKCKYGMQKSIPQCIISEFPGKPSQSRQKKVFTEYFREFIQSQNCIMGIL